MTEMAAGLSKIGFLAVLDEVATKRESVIITKHGGSIVKITRPVKHDGDDIFGFLAGRVGIIDNNIAMVLSPRAAKC